LLNSIDFAAETIEPIGEKKKGAQENKTTAFLRAFASSRLRIWDSKDARQE
jgi:hypothetical protein